ncbi:hypothetical protein KAT51_01575 [bacterium]|nr:hypothetical protein [bacterium]
MRYLKKHRDEILIFSFSILLSLIVTYPLIFRMKSHMYGHPGDPLGMIWLFWWLKYSAVNHISFSFCPLIAVPFGANYGEFSHYTVSLFFTKSFVLLTNEVFTYNLTIFTSFFFALITMYYLVFYFTKNKVTSMISAIIYALSPYHFAHAAQHLGLASIQWMPLYLLFLFKLEEERRYRYVLLTAFTLFLVAFTDYHYLYFIIVVTLAFLLWETWRGLHSRIRLFQFLKVFVLTGLIALIFILPSTQSFLRNILISPTEAAKAKFFKPFRNLFSNSARPLGYLLPSRDNPIFGRYTEKFVDTHFYGGHPVEHTLYLGWVGIMLSIVAVREWRRKSKLVNKLTSRQVNKSRRGQKRDDRNWQTGKLVNWSTRTQKGVSFFLFAGLVALLFSHAPYTEIGNFRILFPSYFMYKVLPIFRVYARFGIVVMLCVSVLAGIGLTFILEKIRNTKKRKIFLSVILLLIFIEFAPTLPAPMVNAVNPPPVYEWLAKQRGDFTIAEYPLEDDIEFLFWQRIHQKRLVNGAQPGTYADKVRKEIVDILKPETPGVLKYLGAKYVILHSGKYLESEDVPVIGEVPDVDKQKGLRLIRIFEEAQVYKIVAEPIEPTIKD